MRHPQAWFWALGPRRMRAEVAEAQATLATLAGAPPRWFRAVVGMANPFTAAAISAHGLARVAWTARGYDAVDSDPERSAARIMRDITPGAIVLLHEGARHGRNVEQLRVLLGCLDDAGYACVQPGIRDRVAAGDAPHLAHDPTGPA
jgi:peptidoglycan/xylan/chitin deacetylase (PgdA/CDA1 family)